MAPHSPGIEWLDRWSAHAAVDPDERQLAGVLSGVLYLTGAVTVLAVLGLPGITRAHWEVVVGIALAAGAWGLVCTRAISWRGAPPWVIHVSNACGLAVVAATVAATGGAGSPAWVYLFFIVVFAASFYPASVVAVYIAGAALFDSLPLLYDPGATDGAFPAQLLIAIASFAVLGGAIVAGKRLLLALRRRAEGLATEHAALRRVATAVAAGRDPDAVYSLVAEEIARLLGADSAGILRFESGEHAVVIGSWSAGGRGPYRSGDTVDAPPGSSLERVLRTGEPVRTDRVVAPVRVNERIWGVLAVADPAPDELPLDAARRLAAFGDLLSMAITNTEARQRLAARASTDPLTGLANHRAFHDRLATEVKRALRHGRPLAVAILDVDHFKQVNDALGHDAGDRVLVRLAGLLAEMVRAEDTLARIGGDEFAWLLPEADREQALAALDRARREVAAAHVGAVPLTISVGICDLASAPDPREMFQLADGALYWSKAHGRNVCWVYDPDVVRELSAQERAEHLQRSQALLGLRALARAIDAKDPTTQRHSLRVSELAARLARVRGWPAERARLLAEAALVHDVGKIGVADALLLKSGRLSAEEYERIKAHADLSAQIVHDVLAPEQVEWIRCHHERPDGRGYPRGLQADGIPEGAALLAVADAWDVMTLSRPYSSPKSPAEALAECRELVGAQFTAEAVDALVRLYDDGKLSGRAINPERASAASSRR
jgi:diguanylate cyclase (GGDEF)-like protein